MDDHAGKKGGPAVPAEQKPAHATPLRPTAPMLPNVVRTTDKSPIGIGSNEDPSNPLVELNLKVLAHLDDARLNHSRQ